jgi:hypothetical protein
MKKVIVFSVLVLTSWIALAQKNSSVENTEDLRSMVYLQQVYQITAEASGFVPGNTNQRITRVLQIGNDNAVTSKTLSENANLNYIQLGSKNAFRIIFNTTVTFDTMFTSYLCVIKICIF